MFDQVYFSALSGNIISFITGTAISWSSPILPKLNETDVDINPVGRQIDSGENSWISSFLPLGAIFGPFLFGYAADKFGRKFTLLALAIPYIISYLTLAFAKIVGLFYFARFLMGLAVGGVFTVFPMYTGEIAEDKNRGTLGSVMNVFITSGLLFSYCVGPYVSVMAFNIILAVIPCIYLVLFFFLAPESPHYYISKGNHEAASKSLEKIRSSGSKNDAELEDIKASIEKSQEGSISDLFSSKGLVKGLTISVLLIAFQQLSGVNVVLFYAQTIFQASGSNLEPAVASIVIGVVQFLTSFVTPILVERLGRKILLCFSALGMLIAQVPLGLYFFMMDNGDDVDAISWLPFVSLMVYIISYNCGFGPIPWAMMGELFPSNVKSVASAMTSMCCWFIGFLITKFFQSVADAMGMGPSFWMFGGFCIVAFLFTLFFVIETKGKSLQEIQDILES
ncbi:facilitated trehalose transporter Tret1-like [Tribolium madens]|uniref:facilitated trehalose transporter Tret1-like n=1 Tax=Tribolium madens TaxID=41895 RepID=UPI001CF7494E|nr:facilitated trehalose transporter Tret1-like [Tribolium madens]